MQFETSTVKQALPFLKKFDKTKMSHNNAATDNQPEDTFLDREQDRLLPIANVARIMKCALPTNAKIAKDAKETIQECVSEFILFVTSEASDRCQQEKRKTVNGEDLLWALKSLGFDNYEHPLAMYLQKYRDNLRVDKLEQRQGIVVKDPIAEHDQHLMLLQAQKIVQQHQQQASRSGASSDMYGNNRQYEEF